MLYKTTVTILVFVFSATCGKGGRGQDGGRS